MKKLLAITLALAMMMSMAAVSFAAEEARLYVSTVPFDYDADTNIMILDASGIEYGDTVYFNIYDDYDYSSDSDYTFGGDRIASSKFMDSVKIKTKFEMGEELVESVELVKMRASIGGDDEFSEYFIAVKLVDKAVTAEADVVGTFTINRKALKAKDTGLDYDIAKVDDMEVDFAFPVFFERNWTNGAYDCLVDGDTDLVYDEAYALKFDYDDEVELSFGGANGGLNEGVFTVDVSGQGKVFLKWNTEADEAIAAANEGAELRFVNFGGAKFNRAGEFVYELEDAAAAYEIVDGKLVEIPGVEIADDEISFRTNKLGSYVFAKSALVNP